MDGHESDLDLDDDDLYLDLEQRILHNSNGEPLEDEIELWVQRYFQSVIEILNGFFAHVSSNEAVARFETISFAELINEQLEGEPPAVIELAISQINDLKAIELEFMRAYCE